MFLQLIEAFHKTRAGQASSSFNGLTQRPSLNSSSGLLRQQFPLATSLEEFRSNRKQFTPLLCLREIDCAVAQRAVEEFCHLATVLFEVLLKDTVPAAIGESAIGDVRRSRFFQGRDEVI